MVATISKHASKTSRLTNKTRLLIVVRSLTQAGSERWVYEICKHIDKRKFEVGVLCDAKYLDSGAETTFENYYYQKLKQERDVTLYEYLGSARRQSLRQRGFAKMQRVIDRITGKNSTRVNPKIVRLLESYDVTCVVNFYNYERVKSELHESAGGSNFFVVLHSHLFQLKPGAYSCFDADRLYHFLYFCPAQIKEIGESGLDTEKNRFFDFPLVIDLRDYPYLFNALPEDSSENPVVISIFTRISRSKPIGMFVEAFGRLQKRAGRRCVLNIYGEIQHADYYEELRELIGRSEIEAETVRFMGHSADIGQSIKADRINIYWGTTFNLSAGYSSVEIAAMGVPCIFWNDNAEAASEYVEKETKGLMLAPNRVEEFVAGNLRYLESGESLAELSAKQREYFIKTHNITDKIKDFEDYVVSLKH